MKAGYVSSVVKQVCHMPIGHVVHVVLSNQRARTDKLRPNIRAIRVLLPDRYHSQCARGLMRSGSVIVLPYFHLLI